MNLKDKILQADTIFLDTAPIIYYIESHSEYGRLAKEIIDILQTDTLVAFSSVITLTEVLPKPIKTNQLVLAKKFIEFLRYGKNINLIEISTNIAEKAGILRGKYPSLKGFDAIQIAAAINAGTDIFITNDINLKQIKEIEVLVLKDYL